MLKRRLQTPKKYRKAKNVNESTAEEHLQIVRTHDVGKKNLPNENKDETLIIHLERKRIRKIEGISLMSYPMKNKIKVEKITI